MKKWRGELGSEGAALVAANGCVSYSADMGLVVAVDGVDNLPASVVFSGIYVIATLCPPADFYKSEGQVSFEDTSAKSCASLRIAEATQQTRHRGLAT